MVVFVLDGCPRFFNLVVFACFGWLVWFVSYFGWSFFFRMVSLFRIVVFVSDVFVSVAFFVLDCSICSSRLSVLHGCLCLLVSVPGICVEPAASFQYPPPPPPPSHFPRESKTRTSQLEDGFGCCCFVNSSISPQMTDFQAAYDCPPTGQPVLPPPTQFMFPWVHTSMAYVL